MKVLVNNKETDVVPGTLLCTLAHSLELPEKGVAIAVNNKMIPKTEWEAHELRENDQIIIIKAACGG